MSVSDHVQPFQLEQPGLRGRLLRLGPVLDSLIVRHDYPLPVARLLAEAVTLAGLLAGMLKFDGVFTLQARGSGAVSTLVADITSGGFLRAYAGFSPEQLTLLGNAVSPRALLGGGHLAFTVDQGGSQERYQGLVELQGETLTDFIQHYFRQSEQIDSAFRIAVHHDPLTGWRAGGLMLQRLPEHRAPVGPDEEDGWRRCMLLMSTLADDELVSPRLSSHDLLFRLFHEEGVRVWPPLPLEDRCRCSRERVATVLQALTGDDIAEMTRQGPAEVRCQFCARTYTFTAEDIAGLREP